MKSIILPFSRRSMALLAEYIIFFSVNLNTFSVYINAFWYSLLAFQPPSPHLLSLDIILLFYLSFSLSLLLYSKEMLHSPFPVAKYTTPTVDRFIKDSYYQT